MRLWRALGLGLGVATGAGLVRPASAPEAQAFTEAERSAARATDEAWLSGAAPQRPPHTPAELGELEDLLDAPVRTAWERARLLEQLALQSGPDRWRFWTRFETRDDFVDADVPMVVDGLLTTAADPHAVATYLEERLGSAAWARAALRRCGQSLSKTSEHWPVLTRAQLERLSELHGLGDDRAEAVAQLLRELSASEAKAYRARLEASETPAFLAAVEDGLVHHDD